MFQRKITIADDKIKDLLTQRDENIQEGRKLQEEIEGLQQKQQKIGLQLNRIKEKVSPLVIEHVKTFEMNEFEQVTAVKVEGSEVIVEVTDTHEFWIHNYREKNNLQTDENSDIRPEDSEHTEDEGAEGETEEAKEV